MLKIPRYEITIYSETQMQQFAERLAPMFTAPLWVGLTGNLGAGKTTLTRYVLNALGHHGSVKSPTYTLVEPYKIAGINFYHFDLYRLTDAEELEYLGIRDYSEEDTIAFVEWVEKGSGFLPAMDLSIVIDFTSTRRYLLMEGLSEKGHKVVSQFLSLERS